MDVREFQRIQEEFHRSRFIVCLDEQELDEVLSEDLPVIYVRVQYRCFCYPMGAPRQASYIVVRRPPEKDVITARDAVRAMVKARLDTRCNHRFLEGFEKYSNNEFDTVWGS